MTALLTFLTPRAWGVIGLAVLLAFSGVQTLRLAHAKADLAHARAALRNPATGHAWSADYAVVLRDLGTCHANLLTQTFALGRQNVSLALAEAASRRTAAALAEADRRSRLGQDAARRRASALLAGRPGSDACQSGLEVARNLP